MSGALCQAYVGYEPYFYLFFLPVLHISTLQLVKCCCNFSPFASISCEFFKVVKLFVFIFQLI